MTPICFFVLFCFCIFGTSNSFSDCSEKFKKSIDWKIFARTFIEMKNGLCLRPAQCSQNLRETKFFKPRAVSRDPSGDRVMPRAEVRVRAQASDGNITVLSHLNSFTETVFSRKTLMSFYCRLKSCKRLYSDACQ